MAASKRKRVNLGVMQKNNIFISIGKFLHNCAALVSLFKPPMRLKKSITGKLAPMRGKLTINRDEHREDTKKENSMGSRYGSFVHVCLFA